MSDITCGNIGHYIATYLQQNNARYTVAVCVTGIDGTVSDRRKTKDERANCQTTASSYCEYYIRPLRPSAFVYKAE